VTDATRRDEGVLAFSSDRYAWSYTGVPLERFVIVAWSSEIDKALLTDLVNNWISKKDEHGHTQNGQPGSTSC